MICADQLSAISLVVSPQPRTSSEARVIASFRITEIRLKVEICLAVLNLADMEICSNNLTLLS